MFSQSELLMFPLPASHVVTLNSHWKMHIRARCAYRWMDWWSLPCCRKIIVVPAEENLIELGPSVELCVPEPPWLWFSTFSSASDHGRDCCGKAIQVHAQYTWQAHFPYPLWSHMLFCHFSQFPDPPIFLQPLKSPFIHQCLLYALMSFLIELGCILKLKDNGNN